MKVNGETLTLAEPVTLAEFLVKTGHEISQIAVERNGQIIPKKEYGNVRLHDDDTLEILAFMGGG
jgi:sulfur carrier protein